MFSDGFTAKNCDPYRTLEAKYVKPDGFLKVRSRILDRGVVFEASRRVGPPVWRSDMGPQRDAHFGQKVLKTYVFLHVFQNLENRPPQIFSFENVFSWKSIF